MKQKVTACFWLSIYDYASGFTKLFDIKINEIILKLLEV